jgi:hypothetical protein
MQIYETEGLSGLGAKVLELSKCGKHLQDIQEPAMGSEGQCGNILKME